MTQSFMKIIMNWSLSRISRFSVCANITWFHSLERYILPSNPVQCNAIEINCYETQMHIGYIPDRNVIGISKLPRIADMFSRRLQIQERLTKDVANAVMEILKPQGVAVVMESSHLCMVMRGVEKTSASTITSCVLGCIEKREKTRNEFFSLVGLNRR